MGIEEIWYQSYLLLNVAKMDLKYEKTTENRGYDYVWPSKIVQVEGRQVEMTGGCSRF